MENKSPENDSKTAIIIHEINQPLSAMTMLANLTMNEMNEPPTEERDEIILSNLKEIVSQGQRCSQIIEKMKNSNNVDTTTFERTNINALIIRTLNEIQFYDGVENINIRQNLEHNLPNMVVDNEAIRRVLTNLLRNAIDAMDNSSKKILTVSSRKTEGGVNIEVADTGCGIDKIDKQKIFESNYTTKGKDGMGIGLSVCKDIITKHNGALTVTSELNQGTSFRVFLPFNDEYKQNTVDPEPKPL